MYFPLKLGVDATWNINIIFKTKNDQKNIRLGIVNVEFMKRKRFIIKRLIKNYFYIHKQNKYHFQ